VISPYVRRLRLGWEVETRRKAAKLTTDKLARMVSADRSKLSRLEGGKIRPDLDFVYKLLEALGVDGKEWAHLATIAREATEKGWWESQPMDHRQALFADLEAGATTIREYQQTVVPGLLQTEAYTRALNEHDDLTLAAPAPSPQEMTIRARAGRQRMLRRPGGPSYEVVLDEMIVRRETAPRRVLAEQLRALATTTVATVRVLPVSARIEAYSVPKSAFSLYTYADPGDPTVAAVEMVAADLALTDVGEVKSYEQLFDRLRKATLSEKDSARLLAEAADEMERIAA
jgi:transcriptional regulator with XRE-family HTH domain